jgi:hypothetical protein
MIENADIVEVKFLGPAWNPDSKACLRCGMRFPTDRVLFVKFVFMIGCATLLIYVLT